MYRGINVSAMRATSGAVSYTLRQTARDYRPGGIDLHQVMVEGSIRTTGTSARDVAIDVLLEILAQLGYDPAEADRPM